MTIPISAISKIFPLAGHELPRQPGGPARDVIRTDLFDPRSLRPLPFDLPTPPNPFEPGAVPSPESPDVSVRSSGALAITIPSPEIETVTLLNTDSLRVDGVSYTRDQDSLPGSTIKF